MNVSLELDDDLAQALLELTGAEGLEEAVVIAAESFVRLKRLEPFRALGSKVDIMSNEELEAADLERNRQLWGDPHPDDTQEQTSRPPNGDGAAHRTLAAFTGAL